MCVVRFKQGEHSGIYSAHNVSVNVVFFKTCADCLLRLDQVNDYFREGSQHVAFFYRKSHTRDVLGS